MLPEPVIVPVYDRDVLFFKRYGDSYYKLINMRSCRRPGVGSGVATKNTLRASVKSIASIKRTRSVVQELAVCNSFDLFGTSTIDKLKLDRYDFNTIRPVFAKAFNHLRDRKYPDLRIILVPEQHKDGAWHFHFLIMGLPVEALELFTLNWKSPSGKGLPERIRKKVRRGATVYNWPDLADRFGFVTLEPIRDREKCANYISKYITKNLLKTDIPVNDHLYYCSQGLQRSEVVLRGFLALSFEPDFCNEYVAIKRIKNPLDALQYFDDFLEYQREHELACLIESWADSNEEPMFIFPTGVVSDADKMVFSPLFRSRGGLEQLSFALKNA
ncbi:hypothetical protein FACS18949_17340 [Clostridia bacterium]|nr:hypothetical protein FACS18949_17340 [Clostridia bacterium]